MVEKPSPIALFVMSMFMLLSGSFNTVVKRFQNLTKVTNLAGEKVLFAKPWTQTGFMFIGEMSVLMVWAYETHKKRIEQRKKHQLQQPLLDDDDGPQPVPTSPFLLMLPTIGDLLGTSLGGVGLLYIPASVWQVYFFLTLLAESFQLVIVFPLI